MSIFETTIDDIINTDSILDDVIYNDINYRIKKIKEELNEKIKLEYTSFKYSSSLYSKIYKHYLNKFNNNYIDNINFIINDNFTVTLKVLNTIPETNIIPYYEYNVIPIDIELFSKISDICDITDIEIISKSNKKNKLLFFRRTNSEYELNIKIFNQILRIKEVENSTKSNNKNNNVDIYFREMLISDVNDIINLIENNNFNFIFAYDCKYSKDNNAYQYINKSIFPRNILYEKVQLIPSSYIINI